MTELERALGVFRAIAAAEIERAGSFDAADWEAITEKFLHAVPGDELRAVQRFGRDGLVPRLYQIMLDLDPAPLVVA